jgi:phenylalanyl-tRNA synthetase beta chain
VTVPNFRVDIEREIDLIEEVARLNGYENVPLTMPQVRISSGRPSPRQRLEKKVKNLLVSLGLSEVITYSFINSSACDKILLGSDDSRRQGIQILNPLTEEQSVMRTSLLPGLLEAAARNANFRILDINIFEMRRVYQPLSGKELPAEPLHLAALLTGSRESAGWNRVQEIIDFFDVKGIIEILLGELGINHVSYSSHIVENFYHPGKSCSIMVENERLGSIGELHPDMRESYGFEKPAYYFELNFESILSLYKELARVSAPPRFPETSRDIAMLIADEIETGRILKHISSLNLKELEKVDLFDLYTGAHVPSGQKSIAVRISYRSSEKTLNEEEVSRLHQRVINDLSKEFNITIR